MPAPARARILDAVALDRALTRIAHEIVEKNKSLDRLGLVGVQTRGVPLARRLAGKLGTIEGAAPPVGLLDINLYRADLQRIGDHPGLHMLPRDQLLQVKRIAEREGLMLHMHVAQDDREIDQMLKRYGQRTPAFLDDLGYLDDQLLAVHLTEASDDEATLIARRGARMALCSGSIAIIDGIVPPAHAFRSAGGLVALGSDQASGNNCNNIFNEMKLTALFNKIKFRDPTIMPAWDVLRMATVEGARAIGLGDEIGSLEAGKQADLPFRLLAAACGLPL